MMRRQPAWCAWSRPRREAVPLREERAQATLEYALTLAALLAIVVTLGLLWRAGEEGTLVRFAEEAASHAVSAGGAVDIALY